MWKVKLHKLVIEEDLKKIDQSFQKEIIKTIYKKLSVDPKKCGSVLRYSLKGFWKLKVSKYRVIYLMEQKEVIVLVLKIGMRRDNEVYKEMMKRIDKLKQ